MNIRSICVLFILISSTVAENPLDIIWDSIDIYFRDNYPN